MGVPACQMFTWDMFEAGCAQSAWGGVGWGGEGEKGGRSRAGSWDERTQSSLERVRLSVAPIPGGNTEIML